MEGILDEITAAALHCPQSGLSTRSTESGKRWEGRAIEEEENRHKQ
jgi:hypothetical protein